MKKIVLASCRRGRWSRAVNFVGGDSRGDEGGIVRWAFQQAKVVGARAFFFWAIWSGRSRFVVG